MYVSQPLILESTVLLTQLFICGGYIITDAEVVILVDLKGKIVALMVQRIRQAVLN